MAVGVVGGSRKKVMTHKMNFGFALVFIKHLQKPAVVVKIFCTVMVQKILRIKELKSVLV